MGIWPRAGTVSVANGSNVVTGDLTNWGASVQPGNAIFIDGGNYPYEIDHLDDTTPNTKLYLVEEYAGASVAGAPYKIIPFFGDRTPMAVATLVAQQRLVASQTDVIETSGAPDPSISPGNIGGKSLAFDPTAKAYYYKLDDGTWAGPVTLGGDPGTNGINAGFLAVYSNNVAINADPGAGAFRFNNAAIGSATGMAIDDTAADTGNPNVRAFIQTWDDSTSTVKGFLVFRKVGIPGTYFIFAITGMTAQTGYTQFVLTYVGGAGAVANGDVFAISFTRTGDKGLDGAGAGDFVGPAGATANNLVAFNGATGKSGKDSGVAPSTDGTLAANSDALLPTQKAVKTAIDGKTGLSSYLDFPEIASPATPAASKMRFYAKTDGNFYMKDPSGVEQPFAVPYAVGTFTPNFTFLTPGNLSVAYANQEGHYTRIGDMVFYQISLRFTPTFTTASGTAQVNNLPFTNNNIADDTNGQPWPGMLLLTPATGLTGWLNLFANPVEGQAYFALQGSNAGTLANLDTTKFTSGTLTRIGIFGCCRVAP